MTNEELKALCERVLADDPKMTVHPVRLADACLRLLRENEAMRWEIIALHKVNTALCGDNKTREMADRALEKYRLEARAKLESTP